MYFAADSTYALIAALVLCFGTFESAKAIPDNASRQTATHETWLRDIVSSLSLMGLGAYITELLTFAGLTRPRSRGRPLPRGEVEQSTRDSFLVHRAGPLTRPRSRGRPLPRERLNEALVTVSSPIGRLSPALTG